MGKKSRKQHQDESKLKLCPSLTDRGVIRLVEALHERTSKFSPGVSTNPGPSVWEEYEGIIGLINAIKQRQGPSPVPLSSRQLAIPEFIAWLKSNGAEFNKIEIAEYPKVGYGLRVTESVKEEEVVLKIPISLILSQETVMNDSLIGLVKSEPILTAMPNLVLALVLLNERYSPISFWKPYINMLPDHIDLPLYFNKDDLLELHGSPVLMECISQVRNISRLYTILHKQLRAYSNFSLSLCSVGFHLVDFLWAVSSIMSRQNKIPSSRKPNESTLVLIPLWDLANHSPGRILTDFDTESQCCVSYSMKDFAAGDEFRIFYGSRGNAELFLNQGFTLEDNANDLVKIWIGLSSSASDSHRKTMFERLHLATSGQFIVLCGNIPFSLELVAFVRLFVASEDEIKLWQGQSNEEVKGDITRKTWTEKDRGVLEFLEKRCQLLLLPYKTTVEEDTKLLSDPGITSRLRNIVTLRRSEKLILKNAADFAAKTRSRLEGDMVIKWEETNQLMAPSNSDNCTATDESIDKRE